MSFEELFDYIKSTLTYIEEDEFNKIVDACNKFGIRLITDFDDDVVPREYLIKEIPIAYVNKLYTVRVEKLKKSIPESANTVITAENVLGPVTTNSINYKINWQKIGYADERAADVIDKTIQLAIKRKIILEIIKDLPEAKIARDFFRNIASQIVEKCAALGDHVDESTEVGTITLIRSLENSYRHFSSKIHGVKEGGPCKRAKKSDTLGCVQHSPPLPEGETAATQEAIRLDLIVVYESRANSWDLTEIRRKMDTVYSTVRRDINDVKSISFLQKQWPFLFNSLILLDHFKTLTGIDAEEMLTAFATDKLDELMKFMTHHSRIAKEAALMYEAAQTTTTDFGIQQRFLAALRMVICYMKDDKQHVYFEIKEPTASNGDIEAMKDDLPQTPVIAAVGDNAWVCTDFRLMVDHIVVTNTCSFTKALALLFASYYIFNIQYSTKLKGTMEYLQTAVMKIEPKEGAGSKNYKKGGGDTPAYRQKVSDLVNGITLYRKKLEAAKKEFAQN